MSKKEELKKIFNKIYLKIYLGKKESNNQFIFLDLVREEIKIIILSNVAREFERVLLNVINKSQENPRIDETIDFLFRLIFLASKNKILMKLNIQPPKYTDRVRLKKNWLWNLIEFESYVSVVFIVKNLMYANAPRITLHTVVVKLLLEHLVLKLSDLIIYDIFLTKKISLKILTLYSIDELLLTSYSTRLVPYLTWKIDRHSLLPLNINIDVSIDVLTFTKTGIETRTTIIENPYSTTNLRTFIISRPLKLLENVIFSLLQFLVKK